MPKPLKKQKGCQISTFLVQVKHTPNYPKKYIAMEIKDVFKWEDDIKAVRVSRAPLPKGK